LVWIALTMTEPDGRQSQVSNWTGTDRRELPQSEDRAKKRW
jgi:hypothetical protein